MQSIPIDENVFCHAYKQFHRMLLSHVTVADPDSRRLEPTSPERALKIRALRVCIIQYPQNFCFKNCIVQMDPCNTTTMPFET